MTDQDTGDESDYDAGDRPLLREAREADDARLMEILDGVTELAWGTFEAVVRAQAMRDCCAACAREANGEDGS